jgi:hypothetical protein
MDQSAAPVRPVRRLLDSRLDSRVYAARLSSLVQPILNALGIVRILTRCATVGLRGCQDSKKSDDGPARTDASIAG